MHNPVIISVGGGKGGIGKSTVTANLGVALAQLGSSVGFLDGDLGGANLHTCLGIKRPRYDLQDFIAGRVALLSDIATPTPVANTWLIGGASDILELANPLYQQKQQIISQLKTLNADYILVDLGAGTSTVNSDFFCAFACGIVVSDGLPTSIENAYGYLKNGITRGFQHLFATRRDILAYVKRFADPRAANGFATVAELLQALGGPFPDAAKQIRQWLAQRTTLLVLNMVRENDDVAIGQRFVAMVKKYLDVTLTYIGYVIDSPEVRVSIRAGMPAVLNNPASKLSACFGTLARNLTLVTKR